MKLIIGQTGIETIIEPWMPPNACIVLGKSEVVYFRDGKTEIMSREMFDDLMYQAEQRFMKEKRGNGNAI